MAVKVMVSPDAKKDLIGIQAYICDELCNPDASARILRMLKKAIESLENFPERGSSLDGILPVHTDFRYLLCENYRIFYLTNGETAEVIRVLHTRQNFMAILFGSMA